MLNDRERQCLASIEAELRSSDPRLVARFRSLERVRRARTRGARIHSTQGTHRSMHGAGMLPCLMLAGALLLMLVGGTMGATTLVVVGVVAAVLTLGVAATTAIRPQPGPGLA